MINGSNFFENYQDINEIIEGKLWLGNMFAAMKKDDLKRKGITKVLTIMDSPENSYTQKDGIKHKIIEIRDVEYENIIQYFGECLNFIEGNERVLVHCAVGASRSSTIVIAYIMWKTRMKCEQAHQYVQKRRPVALPNTGFQQQLKMFEKLLIQYNYNIDFIPFKDIKWVYVTYSEFF